MRSAISIALALASTTLLSAQAPSFEIASVKVAVRQDANLSLAFEPGQVTIRAAPLRQFLPSAFGVPLQLRQVKFDFSRISRDLLDGTYFDIQAKGDPAGDRAAMMQTLLRDRFGLKWHKEVRTMPLYRVTVKQPGKLGPWLKATTVNCRELWAKASNAAECQSTRRSIGRDGYAPQVYAGTNVDLIATLQSFSPLPLIDATGLEGNYLWNIGMPWSPGLGSTRAAEHAAALRDALEDQLGLTITRTTGPWEVIVIDRVQMPTPN